MAVNLFPFDRAQPVVSDRYPDQRWFEGPQGRFLADGITVYRQARLDLVELTVRAGEGRVCVAATHHLNPVELRELAGMLINAALDIEENPSAALMAAQPTSQPHEEPDEQPV